VDGHFQAFIGSEFARWQNPPYNWVDVPEDSVLHKHDNPTGEGVACWAGSRIICFVEGNRRLIVTPRSATPGSDS